MSSYVVKQPQDKELSIEHLASFVNTELLKQQKEPVKFFISSTGENIKGKASSQSSSISVYALYDGHGYKTKFGVGYDWNSHAQFNYGFAFTQWFAYYYNVIFGVGTALTDSPYVAWGNVLAPITYVPSSSIQPANTLQMVAFVYDIHGILHIGASELVMYGYPPIFW